ncbi:MULTISPECIES: nitroreductase family deazaflavin-dependent oxidoreductase [Microbacterium]|uniref:Nitroreductase family deazaflavin-dependent oxidoreductase n=1 Tax=Microbacterium schleiferi TaxID=69362 RepID=A0ABU7V2L7_9MICO|nr:nitroreductase family deazaflavin-dependent oxidoreductase [Microbacterium sp. 67-17]
MTQKTTDAAGAATPAALDQWAARLLQTRWIVRAPIPLFRAGLGWLFGGRFVMVEHTGRKSGEPRYVVLEVIERETNALRVASGHGPRAQWLKNLAANPAARLWVGRSKGVPAMARVLPEIDAAAALARYARVHPDAWDHLKGAMDELNGGEAIIPVVEFTPPSR